MTGYRQFTEPETGAILCPVCGHGEFKAYNSRENAMCGNCGAFERGRLAWMILSKLELLRQGTRLLNLAPEPFMLHIGARALGSGYEAADFDPSLFAKWGKPIRRLDLCSDISSLPAGGYDVIMHNHVLEHVPCNVVDVLRQLNRAIAPGGLHLFSVPIRPNGKTTEDLSHTLSPEERRKHFGQEDHMRYFGELDFGDVLQRADMETGMVGLRSYFNSEEIRGAALPAEILDTVNSHRVFAWRSS